MMLEDFLDRVITTPSGWFCLGSAAIGGGDWENYWFAWPSQLPDIVEKANELKDTRNVYFSAYLFSDQNKIKENVIPSRTIQADLDEADLSLLTITPSFLIETSPDRHQAYFILSDQLELDAHEILSRKITYSIPKCDFSGWSIGHMVRLPTTLNHKYLDGPYEIKVLASSGHRYTSRDLELLPDKTPIMTNAEDNDWVDGPHPFPNVHYLEILESVRYKLPTSVYANYGTEAKDRSSALWSLMCSLFRSTALGRDIVYYLAYNSANNKFSQLRYNGDKELAKDVLRAESIIKNPLPDVKEVINNLRRDKTILTAERRQLMSKFVMGAMQKEGEFFRANDDTLWFVRRDTGRPISINRASEHLDSLLDLQFGLNGSEVEKSYVLYSIMASILSSTPNATLGSLSHYDSNGKLLLIHSGHKEVYAVSPDNILSVSNGAFGIIFPWNSILSAFQLNFKPLPDGLHWHNIMFDMSLDNVIGITRVDAEVLLRVWFLFMLMREAAVSRPILALFGRPGSGKSTLCRRIYTLLYGKGKALGSITTAEDFDHAMSVNPFYAIDNVDTWEKWFPDRLALAASTSDIIKRKYYTNTDTIVLKRQALVAVTAHNPRFNREDIADRLLLLTFDRLEDFIPEGEIMDKILTYRDQLWGDICLDLQKVLRTPMEYSLDIPQFRIEDFARLGFHIATALGIQKEFCTALEAVGKKQRDLTIEDETMLVTSMMRYCRETNQSDVWLSAGQLWQKFETKSDNQLLFLRAYKNPTSLGKKLWTMKEALKEIFAVERKFDSLRGYVFNIRMIE